MAVDVPLPHLDRFFDYAIPDDLAQQVTPGCRVRVRFAGRQRDGYVIDVLASSDSDRELAPLLKVVSPEPVLRPEIVGVVRAVADHYAGTFAQTVGAQWLFIQDPSAATIAAGVAAAVHRQRAARAVSARAALGGA